MNLADFFIASFFIAALVRGIELGLVQQLFSTIGFIGGLFAGAFLQHIFIQPVQAGNSRALLSLLVILGTACIFLFIGELVGGMLKMRLRATERSWLNSGDKIGGSAIAGVTLLVVVWLISGPASNVPDQMIQAQVRESTIITRLNNTFPDAPKILSRIGKLINPNGFPRVFIGSEPALDTTTPLPSLGDMQAGVEAARAATVKIAGRGCGGTVNGSGFIADKGLVITNAHVVAGVERPVIIDGNGSHPARAAWFDPELDLAILRAVDVTGQPLPLVNEAAPNGTPGAALGFPGGGPFTVSNAVVLDSFTALGHNIYDEGTTERSVYSLKTTIQPGNSGGPLINKDGAVIGVIFAESTSYEDIGYALTMPEVLAALRQAQNRTQAISTGDCAS